MPLALTLATARTDSHVRFHLMSSELVQDVKRRHLSNVLDQLCGKKGERVITVYLDDVVAITFSLDVEELRRDVQYAVDEIYREQNEEYEKEIAAHRKAVQS